MNITEKLKEHFESLPNLQQVWINEAGEWQHFDHPAYPECVTRDEVFIEGSKKPIEGGKKPAKELIENINAAESAEAANAASEEDTRATVVKALEDKLKSFETIN